MNELCDCKIEGDVFKCGGCGQRYHVSLMRHVLEAVAREAYRLGAMTQDAAIQAAVQAGNEAAKK